MEPKWEDFGVLLKKERRRNLLNRLELAKKVNKKPSTIASWEQGYRRPKQQSLLVLSNTLGTPIQQLQSKAGHTPEFNWYVSLTAKPATKQDILLNASEDEKEELRLYLHYIRFKRQVISTAKHST
jgi:transcriptional regulator with XRE-family HTH domain